MRLVDERPLSWGWHGPRPKLNKKDCRWEPRWSLANTAVTWTLLHAVIIQLLGPIGGAAIVDVTAVVSQNQAEANQRKVQKNIKKMSFKLEIRRETSGHTLMQARPLCQMRLLSVKTPHSGSNSAVVFAVSLLLFCLSGVSHYLLQIIQLV